jgi:hypothetical protein
MCQRIGCRLGCLGRRTCVSSRKLSVDAGGKLHVLYAVMGTGASWNILWHSSSTVRSRSDEFRKSAGLLLFGMCEGSRLKVSTSPALS